MKPIKILTNLTATITVASFFVSLALVVISNGKNEPAATVCMYSVIASFVALIFVGNDNTEATSN